MTITYDQTVDIGHGRGRLAPSPARSIARVDDAIGRPLDINSAWRDPDAQQKLYDAYRRYLNGGPWAPIALPPSQSIHCRGFAIDTDDSGLRAILNKHGWYQTVFRWVNGVYTLVEPWHFEYDARRDQHINDPAPAGTGKPTTYIPEGVLKMAERVLVTTKDNNKRDLPDSKRRCAFVNTNSGFVSVFSWLSVADAQKWASAMGLKLVELTDSQFDQYIGDCAAVAK